MFRSRFAWISLSILIGLCPQFLTNTNAQTDILELKHRQAKAIHPAFGQPFKSLIDDVTVNHVKFGQACDLNSPCTGQCVGNCDGECQDWTELNCRDCETALFEADAVVASLDPSATVGVRTCGGTCACDECASSEPKRLDGIASYGIAPAPRVCNDCDNENLSNQAYCQKVAKHLAVMIQNSDQPEVQARAINAALKMVANESRAEALKQLSDSHLDRLRLLNQLHSHTQIENKEECLSGEIKSAMQVIYNQQVRMLSRIETMATTNEQLMQRLGRLEKNVAASASVIQAKHLRIDEASLREARQREIAKLQKEMQILDLRIKEIQQESIQPAGYLEPIYPTPQILEPIPSLQRRR